MNSVVGYSIEKGVGVIRIDNPPVNALSAAVRGGILEALDAASSDASEAILLCCDGRTFIAGADITEFGKPPVSPSLPEVIERLEAFAKPVYAALHGTALGGGLEVAMAAHYRIADSAARVGLPEVKLGLLPGAGGTQRLPRLVGVPAALDIMTLGKPVAAAKALELGLLDAVLDGDLETASLDWVRASLEDGAGPRPTGERPVGDKLPADYFDSYRAGIARRARGQIAPGFIVDLVEMATEVPLAEGLKEERERFIECRNSPQSAALRHVFFAERATSRLPDIPKDTPTRDVASVAVIGAGTMGGGIAMCFASAGIPVTMVEMSQENLDRGLAVVRRNYENSVKRGRYSQAQAGEFLENLSGTTDYADIASVDLVIEAVFESMDVKKTVFRTLDGACKPDAILATNTSYLDVNEIAGVTSRPESVIGAHFFSPANVMKLLEVVRAKKTALDVVQTFMKLARKIGKIPVAVGVCHGFVGNRMLRPYARQAQLLLLEGASPAEVDGAMESWGMAMGPLAVGDLAGLDIGYRSRQDRGIESCSVMEYALADALVEMGRLGQKTDAGYYRYDPETRARETDELTLELIDEVSERWEVTRRAIEAEEIVERMLLALINEGAAIVREGIAARPADIDVVYLNGYGFPAWRGGPMFQADQLGLGNVIERLRALEAKTSDSRWAPDALLQQLLEDGRVLGDLNDA